MRPHDSVMMNGADDSALAPIMRSSMVVNLDTRIEPEAFDQTIGIENGVEVDPDVAIVRPRFSSGNHAAPLIADVLLRRQQVLAQAGVFVQFLQLVLAARTLIKDA